MTKILIIGLGGVGVIAAHTLQHNNSDVEITAIIRSDYDKVQKEGYSIDSVDFGKVDSYKPTNVFKSVDEAIATQGNDFDYIVVTTKNIPDLNNVEDIYAKAVVPGKTTILLLQNGFGIEKATIARFPQNVVLSGVSMISSTNFAGHIEHVGTDNLAVGVFHNANLKLQDEETKRDEFLKLYQNDKNNAFVDQDVKFTRWRKLIYNACFNTVAAITDLDVGRISEFGGLNGLIIPMMDEIIAVAKSDGVVLPESIKQAMITSDDGEWYAPSMLADVRKGNQIECEVILGNVITIAKENKVAIPYLNTVYELLKLVQWRLKEKNGRVVMPEKRPVPTRDLTKQ